MRQELEEIKNRINSGKVTPEDAKKLHFFVVKLLADIDRMGDLALQQGKTIKELSMNLFYQKQETGWLIELDAEGGIQWLQILGHGKILWTKDASEATRMIRREDAEALRAHFLGNEGIVTEHVWS